MTEFNSGTNGKSTKVYLVTAQPLGVNEKREYVVEAENEAEAEKLGFQEMLRRESEDLLLNHPGQIFTVAEINPEPRIISDLLDNLDYYVKEMRRAGDMDTIPEKLSQYARSYLQDVPLDSVARQALALFTIDKIYRVSAYLDIFDRYTSSYFAKVIPPILDYFHQKELPIFYIVDNTFQNDGRFEAVVEMFKLIGIKVISPYAGEDILDLESVEYQIKHFLAAKLIIMYIEKDSRVNYLTQVQQIATESDYFCIFRSNASANPEVVILESRFTGNT